MLNASVDDFPPVLASRICKICEEELFSVKQISFVRKSTDCFSMRFLGTETFYSFSFTSLEID